MTGWRRGGTARSRFYSMPVDDLDGAASRLWPIIREQVAGTTAAGHDERRLRGVLSRRRAKSQEFFASAAGEWDRVREGPLRRHVLPVGRARPDRPCAGRWRPRLRHRAADGNGRALRGARDRRRRITGHARRGASSPGRAPGTWSCGRASWRRCRSRRVSWTSRCSRWSCTTRRSRSARWRKSLGSSARAAGILVVDMQPHDREEYQQQMGHVWLGFSEKQISRFLTGAGFDGVRVRPLPSDPGCERPGVVRRDRDAPVDSTANFDAPCKTRSLAIGASCLCVIR